MKFVVGRSNLACTIFVPFDCNNNCPFCTSKKMYKEMEGKYDIEAIISLINGLNSNLSIQEYVLTGGEPFANLEMTKRLVDSMDKRCFVNTTLPMTDNIDEVIDYINTCKKIQGINISRHIGFDFKGVANIDVINRITKPIRINTVINKNFSFDKFKEFVEKWGSDTRMINLRADYTKLDTTSLKARDEIETALATDYMFNGAGGCLVCHSATFIADNCHIQYHRGLMFSSVKMGEKTYINDVIITPDGKMYKDWDMKEDKEFNSWILREPNIKPTELVVDVDWRHDGNVKTYFYSVSFNRLSLTDDRDKSAKITNSEVLDETIEYLQKTLKDDLVKIYTA